jgi:hypothetical protein
LCRRAQAHVWLDRLLLKRRGSEVERGGPTGQFIGSRGSVADPGHWGHRFPAPHGEPAVWLRLRSRQAECERRVA